MVMQPFSTPVPPSESNGWIVLLYPMKSFCGVALTLAAIVLGVVYVVFVQGVCLLLAPIPVLHRILTRPLTAIVSRFVLLLAGCFWIQVEQVSNRKGRGAKTLESWNPGPGDIIISNWISWIEILWLAFRFDPMFILPICEAPSSPSLSFSSATQDHAIGRRTGTGSASLSSPGRAPSVRKKILGYRRVSLLSALRATGHTPPYGLALNSRPPVSLEELLRVADRPIVLFPECTTSNGRGMLRFADVFLGETGSAKKFKLFLMCARCDPPTALISTLSHSIPSGAFNPLPHFYTVATNLFTAKFTIRLLIPSESPSGPLFVASEVIPDYRGPDPLAEACATLIAQIGKVKRTRLGWEDKADFTNLYREKGKRN